MNGIAFNRYRNKHPRPLLGKLAVAPGDRGERMLRTSLMALKQRTISGMVLLLNNPSVDGGQNSVDQCGGVTLLMGGNRRDTPNTHMGGFIAF